MICKKDETSKPAQNPAAGEHSPSLPMTSTRNGGSTVRLGGKQNGK